MFWGGYGIAEDQGTGEKGRVSGEQLQVGFSLDGVDQVFGGPGAHFVVRKGDGCQGGVDVFGNKLLVVETDDGNVVRNPEAKFPAARYAPMAMRSL